MYTISVVIDSSFKKKTSFSVLFFLVILSNSSIHLCPLNLLEPNEPKDIFDILS